MMAQLHGLQKARGLLCFMDWRRQRCPMVIWRPKKRNQNLRIKNPKNKKLSLKKGYLKALKIITVQLRNLRLWNSS
jgi:hypothetical protein